MLSREFTGREKLLLLICAILALGVFYYEFAYRNITDQIASYDTASIQNELEIANARADQISKMETIIEENNGKYKGNVATYNNLANEVSEIGSILNQRADNISLTWNDPTLTGHTVRRDVDISFHADGYTQMMAVLNALNTCRYRCILKDVSVTVAGSGRDNSTHGIADGGDLNVSLTVTFFETTDGAADTNGLTVVEDDSDPSELEERAKAYE